MLAQKVGDRRFVAATCESFNEPLEMVFGFAHEMRSWSADGFDDSTTGVEKYSGISLCIAMALWIYRKFCNDTLDWETSHVQQI